MCPCLDRACPSKVRNKPIVGYHIFLSLPASSLRTQCKYHNACLGVTKVVPFSPCYRLPTPNCPPYQSSCRLLTGPDAQMSATIHMQRRMKGTKRANMESVPFKQPTKASISTLFHVLTAPRQSPMPFTREVSAHPSNPSSSHLSTSILPNGSQPPNPKAGSDAGPQPPPLS